MTTTRSLALAVDNTRPSPPRPGYRQSLRDGKCQKCRTPGVRTVGMREPDAAERTFRKLALCAACVEAAQSEGYYPVVAAVTTPVLPIGDTDMPEPGKLPAARVPAMAARFAGKCPVCADPVAVGDMITRGTADGKWRHARCAL